MKFERPTLSARSKHFRKISLTIGLLLLSFAVHILWAGWKSQQAVFRADVPHYLPLELRILLLGLVCAGVAALIERAQQSSGREGLNMRKPALFSSLFLTVFTPAMYAFSIPFFGILIFGIYVSNGIKLGSLELAICALAACVKIAIFYFISSCVLTVFRRSGMRAVAFVSVWIWSAIWVLCVQGSYGL
jgi:hypothetical protein